MTALWALLRKDIALELRQRELLGTLLFLTVGLSAIAALGVANALVEPPVVRALFPALFWMIFLFAAVASLGRVGEYENDQRPLEAVLLTGVAPYLPYLSKCIVSCGVLFMVELLLFPILAALLGVSVPLSAPFVLVLLLLAVGLSALMTVLGAMVSTAPLRSLLLPFIALPLLFPLFFCAIELSNELLILQSFDPSSFWFSLVIGLDVVYLALGVNLYPVVVRD